MASMGMDTADLMDARCMNAAATFASGRVQIGAVIIDEDAATSIQRIFRGRQERRRLLGLRAALLAKKAPPNANDQRSCNSRRVAIVRNVKVISSLKVASQRAQPKTEGAPSAARAMCHSREWTQLVRQLRSDVVRHCASRSQLHAGGNGAQGDSSCPSAACDVDATATQQEAVSTQLAKEHVRADVQGQHEFWSILNEQPELHERLRRARAARAARNAARAIVAPTAAAAPSTPPPARSGSRVMVVPARSAQALVPQAAPPTAGPAATGATAAPAAAAAAPDAGVCHSEAPAGDVMVRSSSRKYVMGPKGEVLKLAVRPSLNCINPPPTNGSERARSGRVSIRLSVPRAQPRALTKPLPDEFDGRV
jgi:hypothetical protein